MLKLLPPVCRDCGKAAKEAKLSPYLDFQLCGACIARREREVLAVDGRRRKPASKKSKGDRAVVRTKKVRTTTAKKPGGGRGRRS